MYSHTGNKRAWKALALLLVQRKKGKNEMPNLSFNVSQKITKSSNPKGYGNHVFRKSLNPDLKHKNQNIQKDLTKYNLDLKIQGQSFGERFEERLSHYNGKRKMRKDAVLLRGFVAQPSADMFDGKTMREKQEIMKKFAIDINDWLAKEFMQENIIGLSIHLDESTPHLHGAIMPMTEDGRLSQKDFFKNPTQLKLMHKDLRKFMNDKGWDFDLENKHENSKHYELDEYKHNAKAIEAARQKRTDELRQGRAELKKQERSLKALESASEKVLDIKYQTREKSIERQERALKEREKALEAKAKELADIEKANQLKMDDLERQRQEALYQKAFLKRGLMSVSYLLSDKDRNKLLNFIKDGNADKSEMERLKNNVRRNPISNEQVMSRVKKQQQDEPEL